MENIVGRSLAIIGAGGHGSVVADAAALSGMWDSIVFFDDTAITGSKVACWEIMGSVGDLFHDLQSLSACIVAIGDNELRLEMTTQLQQQGGKLVNVIHPAAVISPHSHLESGSAILAGAVVNIGARLGQACIVNNAATVNHDCVISSGVHVGPNAALGGDVTVGQSTWIGIGATVKHGINIGSNVVVGGGAAVVSDIESNRTVIGVPAK